MKPESKLLLISCIISGKFLNLSVFQVFASVNGQKYQFHRIAANAAAKSLQSCPTLSDPMDCSPPGSSIHGISQARALDWGAITHSISLFC